MYLKSQVNKILYFKKKNCKKKKKVKSNYIQIFKSKTYNYIELVLVVYT